MEGLGPMTSGAGLSLGFFEIFFQGESVLTPLYPPLEWLSSPPLVAVVLIAHRGAKSPGSGRMGVIGALVLFFSISSRLGLG